MPVNTAIVIASVILGVTAIAMISFVSFRKRQAQEEEMRQAATTRGWKFDSRSERGARIHRWIGSTDGVAWLAESIRSTSKNDRQHHRQHISRWHGDFSPGVNSPVILMGIPKGKSLPEFTSEEGDNFIVKLAHKAAGFAFDKAIDAYFGENLGKEVDAAAMHRIDAKNLTGFVVLAADKDEGARILSQGLERTLAAAIDDKASVFSTDERPSILLRPHGISLGRMQQFADINELDNYVRAGVGLTRAFTFGRRSLS